MFSLLRRVVIRTMLPLSWGQSPRRVANSLNRFSQVEADSAWQFLRAVEILPSPQAKAEMFENALEEVHHAYIFNEAARKRVYRPLPLNAGSRKALLNDPGELPAFLAYSYIGEHEVHGEFQSYARAAGDRSVQEVFLSICEDEAGHEESARGLLAKALGSEAKLRHEVTSARLRRIYADWVRFSTRLGEAVSGFWLGLLYFLCAPWVAATCRRRLARPPVAGHVLSSPATNSPEYALAATNDLRPLGLKATTKTQSTEVS